MTSVLSLASSALTLLVTWRQGPTPLTPSGEAYVEHYAAVTGDVLIEQLAHGAGHRPGDWSLRARGCGRELHDRQIGSAEPIETVGIPGLQNAVGTGGIAMLPLGS